MHSTENIKQFITIIIEELTSTAVFVFQCCQVQGMDHGIDRKQNFYKEIISADSLLIIPCILPASFR